MIVGSRHIFAKEYAQSREDQIWVGWIWYFDEDTQKFVMREPLPRPEPGKKYESVLVDIESNGRLIIVAKCTYAPKTYKVFVDMRIVEMTLEEIVQHPYRIHNAIVVNEGTSKAYIKLKEGELPKYKVTPTNANDMALDSQGFAFMTHYSFERYGEERYTQVGLKFYKRASGLELAKAEFNKHAKDLEVWRKQNNSSVYSIAPNSGIANVIAHHSRNPFEQAFVALIRMAYDDGTPVDATRDKVYGVHTDICINNEMKEQGLHFFRSAAQAQAYLRQKASQVAPLLPSNIYRLSRSPLSVSGVSLLDIACCEDIDTYETYAFITSFDIALSEYKGYMRYQT